MKKTLIAFLASALFLFNTPVFGQGTGAGSNATGLISGATGGFSDPLTTRGDIIYKSDSATTRLPLGANGLVLKSDGTDITWAVDATGAGSGAFSDAGDPVVLNTPAKNVEIGDTGVALDAKLQIGGDTDEVQVIIEGHSTQTDSILIIQQDDETQVANIENDGTILTAVGIDAIGAVDMDYGSADITDHTFVTDGVGTAEVVLPAGSVDSTEILNGTIVNADINASAAITASKLSGVTTPSSTDTFTNKTFDANGTGNSITNIENADIATGAAIDVSKTALTAGTNITLSTNTLNVDDVFVANTGGDTMAPKLTISDSAILAPLNLTERSTAPSSPAAGDIYLDDGTNTGSGTPGLRRYTGAAWEDINEESGGSGDITTVGDSVSGAAFTADGTGNSLVFEGPTVDTLETTLTAADTTVSDKTITLPNETGTVITSATSLAGDVTGTTGATVVGDDSHNHVITNIDAFTEAQLQTQLSDVTNVFTNNDGSLSDDDVTLADVQTATTSDFHNIGGTDDDTPDNDSEVPDAITVAGGAVNTSAITLDTGVDPTTDGQIRWDSITERVEIGDDGIATLELYPGAHTVDTDTFVTNKDAHDHNGGDGAIIPVAGTALTAGTNITLSTNTLNVDDAFVVNTGGDTMDPKLTISDSATTAPLNLTERPAAPSSPAAGDIYLDDGTNTGSTNPGLRRYTGVAWEDINEESGGSGDVTAVWTDLTGDVSALTAGAGDTIDAGGADSSVPWEVDTIAAQTTEGMAIWKSDTDVLTVGDGVATLTIAPIDSTATLTNKTINTASNTITVVEADISDLTHTTDTNLTQEAVEDFAGALINDGTGTHTGIAITYQDITGDVDMVIDHDAATNFVANEHIDWTGASAGTIHATNYVDNDTTDHTALSNIGTNTHAQIDTHIADTSDPHGATLTQTNITLSGIHKILENGVTPTLYGIFDIADLSTADKTYTFPDATGTVVLQDSTDTLTNKTINTASNTITIVEADISDLNHTTIITRETPSGLINGSNTTYTLANTPVVGSECVFLNGILQDEGAGNDYTISGATITYLTAPFTGDKLRVNYIK